MSYTTILWLWIFHFVRQSPFVSAHVSYFNVYTSPSVSPGVFFDCFEVLNFHRLHRCLDSIQTCLLSHFIIVVYLPPSFETRKQKKTARDHPVHDVVAVRGKHGVFAALIRVGRAVRRNVSVNLFMVYRTC